MEGEKAEFTCSVSKETYEVKWLKDDKELEAGDKYQQVSDGKRRTLVIKNCELKDEGGYVVMIGTTRASADLTVLGTHHPQTLILSKAQDENVIIPKTRQIPAAMSNNVLHQLSLEMHIKNSLKP